MNHKTQLPEKLQDMIDDFYNNVMDGKDILKLIEGITQDALNGIDSVGSEDAGDTYFHLRSIRDFLFELKIYSL